LPNTLYKIICERSKRLGKVQALVIDGCDQFEISSFSIDDSYLMFRGLFNFHGLKQISCIAGYSSQWLDQSKKNCSKFFDDGFEWEKKRYPARKKPAVLFYNDWNCFRANMNC